MAYVLPTDWELKDFYRANVDSLFRCCSFLTAGACDTEAMVKDIFLKLLNKGMIFSSDKDGKAWMILEAYKLSRKAKKYAINPAFEAAAEPLPEAQTPDEAPEESQEQGGEEDANCAVDSAGEASAEILESGSATECVAADAEIGKFPDELRKLSRKDRLIVLLYYCEGFRKSEIASYLGCTTFMVDSRLKKIKKRILQEKGGTD